jgi:hypothetical protein
MIYGSDLKMMEAAITAAQSDGDALETSPEIKATKDQLVANPVAVAYLPIARWVTLAQALTGDGPAPAPAAANVPPMVMSVGVSGTMITAEVHVPIAAITATQEAILRLERAMQGQGVVPNLP